MVGGSFEDALDYWDAAKNDSKGEVAECVDPCQKFETILNSLSS